ncbi:hypothetical protein NDU88_007122 [Pleurodeles waltl]|uniref:Uncharacterized protein n=1 Tax=Pleurodeles waltl TaxID=8319 RepID=A0AAV7VRK6_PLEWA|nr:hypothetical protein NDU88_007122 [Pleurodeles waltl]
MNHFCHTPTSTGLPQEDGTITVRKQMSIKCNPGMRCNRTTDLSNKCSLRKQDDPPPGIAFSQGFLNKCF